MHLITLEDLKWRSYVRLQSVLDKRDDLPDVEFNIKLISILTEQPEQTIRDMNVKDFFVLLNELNDIRPLEYQEEHLKSFQFNDKTWYIDYEPAELSVKQWADVEMISSAYQDLEFLTNLCAILIYTENEDYRPSERLARVNRIYELPTRIVHQITSYFCKKKEIYKSCIQLSGQIQELQAHLETLNTIQE